MNIGASSDHYKMSDLELYKEVRNNTKRSDKYATRRAERGQVESLREL